MQHTYKHTNMIKHGNRRSEPPLIDPPHPCFFQVFSKKLQQIHHGISQFPRWQRQLLHSRPGTTPSAAPRSDQRRDHCGTRQVCPPPGAVAAAGGSPGPVGRGGQGGLDLGLGGEDEQHGGHGDNWKLM